MERLSGDYEATIGDYGAQTAKARTAAAVEFLFCAFLRCAASSSFWGFRFGMLLRGLHEAATMQQPNAKNFRCAPLQRVLFPL